MPSSVHEPAVRECTPCQGATATPGVALTRRHPSRRRWVALALGRLSPP